MAPWYCTREDVKSASDSKLTARDDAQVDRAIGAQSRVVEGCLHRRFYPQTATRTFDWPNGQRAAPWVLWLNDDEVATVSQLVSAGVTISANDYLLRPDHGPPFTRVEIDLDSSAAFGGADTHQRSIAITGVFMGCPLEERPAGALAEDLDTVETAVDVTNGALVGVGTILRVDSERMIVTGRSFLDTTVNLGGDGLTNSISDVVAEITGVQPGELLLVDGERLLVVDVAGSNAIVKRAWDGSVLAAHSAGADVFASRTLTVERGALGTTAAVHTNAAPLAAHVVPDAVRALTVAKAQVQIAQEQAAYGRTVGSSDNEREAAGKGVAALEDAAYTTHGRKARQRAV
jgi:hypothetical protein